MEDDRRSSPRVAFKVPAYIYVGDNQELYRGYVMNMSANGIFVMMDKQVILGANLYLKFPVALNSDAEAWGQLVHTALPLGAGQGFGVELTQTTPVYDRFLAHAQDAGPADIMSLIDRIKRIIVQVW